MTEDFQRIMEMLDQCTPDEQLIVFKKLRDNIPIHQLEEDFGCEAEVILEAIHRAPELTRRMLKGVIADAAFYQYVVPSLQGWQYVPLATNESYDHVVQDGIGQVTIQVKLQRSKTGAPVEQVVNGVRQYIVEVQKTRTGKKKKAVEGAVIETVEEDTRPYRFGDFQILAVSLWPSTRDWRRFRYTVGNWLIPREDRSLIAVMQPVAMAPNAQWTDDFAQAVQWLRANQQSSVLPIVTREPSALDNLLLPPTNPPGLFTRN